MTKKLVIAATDSSRSSFIQAHFKLLPSENFLIEGAALPLRDHSGKYFFSNKKIVQFLESAFERIGLRGFYFRERAIKRYLKKIRPVAILAEYGLTGARMQYIARELQIPLFVYFLGYDAYVYWVLKKYKPHYQNFNQNASGIFCVSKDILLKLKELGIHSSLLHYIPCGPNNLSLQKVVIPKESLNFIAVGSFVQKKNPLLTIQAFELLHKKFPEARLNMVGDGPLLSKAKELVDRLNISDSVIFHGWLKLDEINELYQESRAFVQHSSVDFETGDSEGTPVAILEAGSIGLPVVSTKHAGIKDSVIHEKTGFLVDELDVDSMAKYMIILAEDLDLAREMGNNAYFFVRENFNTKVSIAKMWDLMSKNTDHA